jgi:terminase small subunit-like protein
MRFEDATGMSRETAVEIICEHIASGQSLRAACKSDALPDKSTFLRWMEEDVELRRQYMRARELQADFFVDEIVEISDTEDDPARARVRIDSRKWVAGKQAPKKYSERLGIDSNTTLNLSDPLSALLGRVAEIGAKIYDRKS